MIGGEGVRRGCCRARHYGGGRRGGRRGRQDRGCSSFVAGIEVANARP